MMTNEKLAELQTRGPGARRGGEGDRRGARRDLSAWPPRCARNTTTTPTTAGEILEQIRTAKDDLAIIEKAREIGEAIGGGLEQPGPLEIKDQRLTFKGMAAALARRSGPTA